MKLLVLALVLALPVVGLSAQRYRPVKTVNESTDFQNRIAKAAKGLSWESEGSDNLRVFFLKAAPIHPAHPDGTFDAELVRDIEDQIRDWAKKLPGTYRPVGYKTIETQTIEDLLDNLLNPEPGSNGEVDKDEAFASAKWAVMKDVVNELVDTQVYWLGSEENYQLIVVCGIDAHGNLVGFWMRHWSS